ncbi:hypothetical protein FQA39_LY04752 [Lamprigera yunnana]|nr:hypothetical protein FQA39_LY04752 [Lamprigera yunnana]
MIAENNITSTVKYTIPLKEQKDISLQSPEARKDDSRKKYRGLLLRGKRFVDIHYFLEQISFMSTTQSHVDDNEILELSTLILQK